MYTGIVKKMARIINGIFVKHNFSLKILRDIEIRAKKQKQKQTNKQKTF